jgi:hypothetical protein
MSITPKSPLKKRRGGSNMAQFSAEISLVPGQFSVGINTAAAPTYADDVVGASQETTNIQPQGPNWFSPFARAAHGRKHRTAVELTGEE